MIRPFRKHRADEMLAGSDDQFHEWRLLVAAGASHYGGAPAQPHSGAAAALPCSIELDSPSPLLVAFDIEALIADSGYARSLSASSLVDALVELGTMNRRLHECVAVSRTKAVKVTQQLHDLELAAAERKARLETIEDLLTALHANLEDFRSDRDRARANAPKHSQA